LYKGLGVYDRNPMTPLKAYIRVRVIESAALLWIGHCLERSFEIWCAG
jgi:hypothetical protein